MSSDLPRGALYTPPSETPPVTPVWTRGGRRSRSNSAASVASVSSDLANTVRKAKRHALKYWARLTLVQKVLVCTVLLVVNVGVVLGLIFHEAIFHRLSPVADSWRDLPGGFMILFAWTFISAFPPLIGYSTSVTLAGFIFGLPNGWYIAASGTVIGSTAAFITCRVYFRNFAQKMVATDKRFAALSLTLKHDGLKLLCMIRLCPLPYSISNAALSTFPTVSPLNFAIAGAVASPKLLIHVFIGHQMKVLGDSGQKMTAGTKALNYGSIIGGSILGFVTGWLIYKRTVERAKQLEADERRRAREIVEHSDGGISEHELETDQEGYFDDPVEAQAERTLAGDAIEERYVDEEGMAVKTNRFAGRALNAFNDLFGRTARDGGYETDEEEEGRLLAGDELMDDDEDAEELLVVEDGVVELEEGSRRFSGRTRPPRK
ncbi:Tlg2-vesicle protein [Orbilia brochopaga]|uniref:Golgi apparatus membrane protein TVP38 n=1 Tax=Orbilia brochopaga TaxID=3140254 RepID=A0AAV9UB55_9PEZI